MSSSEQQGVGRPSRARQGTQPSQDNEAPNLLQYRLAPQTVPGSDEAGEPGGGGVLTPHTSSNVRKRSWEQSEAYIRELEAKIARMEQNKENN